MAHSFKKVSFGKVRSMFRHGSILLCILFFAFLILNCGGNGITFPQGPTSGANELGLALSPIQIEPNPSFHLNVTFDPITQIFLYTWTPATNDVCETYEVVTVRTPTPGDPGVIKATVLRVEGNSLNLQLLSTLDLTDFVQSSLQPLSALVLCVENSLIPPANTTYPRSNFSSLSSLL